VRVIRLICDEVGIQYVVTAKQEYDEYIDVNNKRVQVKTLKSIDVAIHI
jgi:hypothetical protein